MSDIGIGALGSTNNEFQSEALQNLDKDAFLQLLVAQMKYQNPLSPVDSNEYLAQAAQYASVEQLENMAQSQAELRSMQMVSIATDLVGKEVTAVNSFTGAQVTGIVEGIRFGSEPVLIVDGAEVALSSVISVGRVPTAPETEEPSRRNAGGNDDEVAPEAIEENAPDGGPPIQENDPGAIPDTTPDDGSDIGIGDGSVNLDPPLGTENDTAADNPPVGGSADPDPIDDPIDVTPAMRPAGII